MRVATRPAPALAGSLRLDGLLMASERLALGPLPPFPEEASSPLNPRLVFAPSHKL